ncbi:MAG: TlpA disulfide reductase family protein [Pseudomonadota bacterium]
MTQKTVFIMAAAALAVVIFASAVVITVRPALFSLAGETGQCRQGQAAANAVEGLSVGHMASFQTIEPRDVSALPFDGMGEEERTLAEFSGKTILFNLWATWCAPCRIEMPHLAALHTARQSDDFAVIATSIDNRDTGLPERFLEETNALALDYYREPSLRLFNSLRDAGLAMGMPTTLLIAPDGCAVGVTHGAADWSSPDALRLIDAAINGA